MFIIDGNWASNALIYKYINIYIYIYIYIKQSIYV